MVETVVVRQLEVRLYSKVSKRPRARKGDCGIRAGAGGGGACLAMRPLNAFAKGRSIDERGVG